MKLLICLILLVPKIPAWGAQDHLLNLGESLRLNGQGRIWVSTNQYLTLNESKNGLIMKAKRPGETLIRIGQQSHRILTMSLTDEQTYQKLSQAIKKTLGLRLVIERAKVKVKGQLHRWTDWKRLADQCEHDACRYLFEAEMTPLIQKDSESKLNDWLQSLGLPPQKLSRQKMNVLIDSSSDHHGDLKKNLEKFGILVTARKSSIDLEPLIKIKITVAEIKRSQSLQYGFQWPGQYSAHILPNTIETSSDPLNIRALEEKGVAKVLASPTILCRSGKSADFLAGGEFPIKLINFKTQDVIWKKHGILLKVSPKADFSGKMSIHLETEVSIPDWANRVDGIPGLSTNRIQSYFDLSEARTIALSGLIRSEEGRKSSGLPGLGTIPILGSLFASKDFIENRTELVVFVRPEVVSPGSLEASL